jgi:hypothetical protein
MATTMLDQHKKWRNRLVYELRMADVPGVEIGDILLEVESHLLETGETPEEAFGEANVYAASRAEVVPPASVEEGKGMGVVMIALLAFVGSFAFVSGALTAGRGEESAFLLNPWIVTIIGAGILAFTLVKLPRDFVRHPATGDPLLGEGNEPRVVLGAVVALAGIVFYATGRLMA